MKDRRFVIPKEYLLAAAVFMLGIIMFFKDSDEVLLTKDNEIVRDSYGQPVKEVTLDTTIAERQYEDFIIEVSPKEYSEETLDDMYQEAIKELVKPYKSDEGLFLETDIDFDFRKQVSGYPFEFTWIPLDTSVISEEGKLKVITETETEISVLAQYDEYSQSIVYPVKIKPALEIRERYILEHLKERIQQTDEATKEDEVLVLPKSLGGLDITYREPPKKKNPGYIIGGLAAGLLLILASYKDKEKKIKERKALVLREYPVMIKKLVLYMCAGMSLRNVWFKICDMAVKEGYDKEPLYEEMIITSNEIKAGVSESLAYERFGERIGDNSIIRFSALLSQNIKKGSTALTNLLSDEAVKAFDERKRNAVKKGEEAGTKLLLPMMLLLIVVLLIIMVPAFRSL